jgi:hypothetical protein
MIHFYHRASRAALPVGQTAAMKSSEINHVEQVLLLRRFAQPTPAIIILSGHGYQPIK